LPPFYIEFASIHLIVYGDRAVERDLALSVKLTARPKPVAEVARLQIPAKFLRIQLPRTAFRDSSPSAGTR
jgi:hypothetical protein